MTEDIFRRAYARGSLWRNYPMTCLAISVGKPVHEGDDLAAAVDLLGKIGKPCVVRVSDTLQRHNLMADGMGINEAWKKSREMGQAWLERNLSVFERLAVPLTFVRWDTVIADADFVRIHDEFLEISRKNPVFSEALARDVERFVSRRSFASREELAMAGECSKAFLLEELAGQTVLGRRFSYARFYPGNPASVLQMVRDGMIEDAPKGLENTAFARFSIETRHRIYNQGIA